MAAGRDPQQRNRETLLTMFHDPDLKDLVASSINKLSDGIDTDSVNGLKLEARGTQQRLLSFYKKIQEKAPVWDIAFSTDKKTEGLNFAERGESRLFLQNGGNIGVGTTQPLFKMQVEGMVSMQGRVGTFASGQIPADGVWHIILNNLDGCQGFEIMAHINDDSTARFALTHAILLMSNKKGSKNRIRSVDAASSWLWGWLFNKIRFKWTLDEQFSTNDAPRYCLAIRSRTRFGMPGGAMMNVFYRVTKLWDRNFENGEGVYTAASGVHLVTEPAPRAIPNSPTTPSRVTAPLQQEDDRIKIKKRE
jgi:hypothetical protein